MGRLFLEHMGGDRVFCCNSCSTALTNRTQLISTRFTGGTGRAYLFSKVSVHFQFEYLCNKILFKCTSIFYR